MERILLNKSHIFVLDGAMGSFLESSGIVKKDDLWATRALIENPEVVINIHSSYIKSGADIITTNTFRTNPLVMQKYNLESKYFVGKAVELCKLSKKNNHVYIAGSNPPAEDCYQVERTVTKESLKYNHQYHISLLYENEVSFILNETISHYDEIEIICEYCDFNKIPFVISLYLNDDGNILSGEPLGQVMNDIIQYQPLAVSLNCISYEVFLNAITSIDLNYNFGFYLNCFSQYYKNSYTNINAAEHYKIVKEFINYHPVFIGSCCGSTPEHTKMIKKAINEINNN